MAQHIGIQIVDENNIILSQIDLNIAELQKFITLNSSYEQNPLLSSIDEYGLTFFNFIQTKRMYKEIIETDFPAQLQEEINKLLNYISQVEQHQLLKLIGD